MYPSHLPIEIPTEQKPIWVLNDIKLWLHAPISLMFIQLAPKVKPDGPPWPNSGMLGEALCLLHNIIIIILLYLPAGRVVGSNC